MNETEIVKVRALEHVPMPEDDMTQPIWPTQAECKNFYGNPVGPGGGPSAKWETGNLVLLPAPWPLVAAWDTSQKIRGIRVHAKCADSLKRVLAEIWANAGPHTEVRLQNIKKWGMNLFGGGYSFRIMRSSHNLSMHAYGCAVDFDPKRNAFGNKSPNFTNCPVVLDAFEREGWVWGGTWSKPDGMHWQAARVG